MSDLELSRSLRETLAGQPESGPVWLFAYGSLMWNPAFDYAERRPGVLRGWERSFCIWISYARGSVDCPALTLALDDGDRTEGVLFRLAAGLEEQELLLVWRREMLANFYRAVWVEVEVDGALLWAIAFVANTDHDAYAGKLGLEEIALNIAKCAGVLGTAKEYFDGMMAHLDGLALKDDQMERLRVSVNAAAKHLAKHEEKGRQLQIRR